MLQRIENDYGKIQFTPSNTKDLIIPIMELIVPNDLGLLNSRPMYNHIRYTHTNTHISNNRVIEESIYTIATD